MSKTYTMCQGMRGERTARGGNDGCRASVQAWDGSVCVRNYYVNDILKVRVGTNDGSSCCTDDGSWEFNGTFDEFKAALNLIHDIKEGVVSVVRRDTPKS